SRLSLAYGEKANNVGHVSAADEQPPAIDGIAQQFGDPANGLSLNFARHWGEQPCTDVGIHRGSEQIAKRADWCRRRGDISHEARMCVEKTMIKQQIGGLREQLRGIAAMLRQGAISRERLTHDRRRFGWRHWPFVKRIEETGDAVNQFVA